MEQDSTKIIAAADALDSYTGDASSTGTGSFMGLVDAFYDKIGTPAQVILSTMSAGILPL